MCVIELHQSQHSGRLISKHSYSCLKVCVKKSPVLWKLERWYRWTYPQGSDGDVDIENRLVDTVGGGDGWTNWEASMEKYTLSYVTWIKLVGICCVTQGTQPRALWQPRGVGWGGRWEGGRRGRGHMYTDGWFMLTYARNHTILYSNSTPMKNIITHTAALANRTNGIF